MQGDRMHVSWTEAWSNAAHEEESVGPLTADAWYNEGYEWLGALPPYWFHYDTPVNTEREHGILIEDETGDARLPELAILDEETMDRYDITFVEANGWKADTAEISLGIKDLSQVTVPKGYDAVVYAVGLQTQAGDFMAFYYKDDEQQDYYCAADTLIFPDEPADPTEAVWTRITGMQAHGGRGPGGAGPSSGTISLYVPHECLGVGHDEMFEVRDLGAGTFLLQNPLTVSEFARVDKVDQVHAAPDELPAQLGVQALETGPGAQPTWFAAPLGLDGQDWDVLGVAIAILLASGGAFVVYQRRRKLRRYLNRVSHTAKIKGLTARETGLGELREALRADLVAGRIAEGHYTIVLRHIEDAMKNVRVKSIEETFRELPFHVVSKLRTVLDDGVITQDEREMVVDLVARAEIADKDKQKVLSRLERWQMVDEVAKA